MPTLTTFRCDSCGILTTSDREAPRFSRDETDPLCIDCECERSLTDLTDAETAFELISAVAVAALDRGSIAPADARRAVEQAIKKTWDERGVVAACPIPTFNELLSVRERLLARRLELGEREGASR